MAGRQVLDRIVRGPMLDGWHERATCRGKPSEWWYSEQTRHGDVPPNMRKALALCYTCPVRVSCAEHAMFYPERYGVWGGTTQAQRRRVTKMDLRPIDALRVVLDVADELGARLGLIVRRMP